MSINEIVKLIGTENENLLSHTCNTISKDQLNLPCQDFIDKVFSLSNRSVQTLRSLSSIFNAGRLSHSGYLSILPVEPAL